MSVCLGCSLSKLQFFKPPPKETIVDIEPQLQAVGLRVSVRKNEVIMWYREEVLNEILSCSIYVMVSKAGLLGQL